MKLTNRIITAQDIIDADACYSEDKVRELIPHPIPISALLDLDIPDTDKVWGVLTMITDKRERVGATSALVRGALRHTGDVRVSQCLDVCDMYARGDASEAELNAAYAAAKAAANAAYAFAADHAAYAFAANANAAANAANANAAASAAYASADYANTASYAAEWHRQVELLRGMLRED